MPIARRLLLLAAVIVLSALPLVLTGAPVFAAATGEIAIQADTVELDLDQGQTAARGSAVLSYGDLELHADHLTADQRSGQITAGGNLTVSQQGRRLQGELLEYNYRTDQGLLSQARVEEQGVIIRGESIEFSRSQILAHDAYFTTCDRPHPHYTFRAGLISLTAEQAAPGLPPQSGRLSLDRASVTYRNRRLFTIPRYSVDINRLREPDATPFPTTGFSQDDGPFASMGYTLGRPGDNIGADFNYRYTTFRGVRGLFRVRGNLGPAELAAAYIRRQDIADQQLSPDHIEFSLANVLVTRSPEYSIKLPDLSLGSSLNLRAEWLRGTYSERLSREVDPIARADRDSRSLLLTTSAYSPAPALTLSHAIGWRRSSYSPGDHLTVRFLRHSVEFAPAPDSQLSLSYITRRGSGETPFLFDQVGIGKELLADLRYRLSPAWRIHIEEVYDLDQRDPKDLTFSLTRTAHCLDYTLGWRKIRGSFFVVIGLAPASPTD